MNSVKVGDSVKVLDMYASRTVRGVVFTVDSISPKGMASLAPVNGGRGVRCPLDGLELTDAPKVAPVDIPAVNVGSLVTVAGAGWREAPGTFYVVTAIAVSGTVRIFPLGGSERGQHWPKIPISHLTVIDPTAATAALATVAA